jgi:hypothetical protein
MQHIIPNFQQIRKMDLVNSIMVTVCIKAHVFRLI